MQTASSQSPDQRRDVFIAAAILVLAAALYVRTLAPSVASIFDDTLEIQYVVPRLGILHPTGYPLYTLLGKLITLLVPIGDTAYRLNLFSAITAACAAGMLYLVTRQVTKHRLPAVIAALVFAFSPTFWEQSNAAEVYALQILLTAIILYLALSWGREASVRTFYLLALAMGLGLAHHRLTLLLYPAVGIYVAFCGLSFRAKREISSGGKEISQSLRSLEMTVARAAMLFIAPLLLYLYLPLRGAVGSANGMYENTLPGFFEWVMGTQYTAFLTQNPLSVQQDFDFYSSLFMRQFTPIGLALAAIGIVWLARKRREWILLLVALATEAAFTFNYRTADVQVHFLTTFLLLAILVGTGIDALLSAIQNSKLSPALAGGAREIPANVSSFTFYTASLILLIVPAQLLIANYPTNDLSTKWDVHDYGIDLLSQPLENNATIIGILGEMTLIRYVQENFGLRPDVQTVPADEEPARLAAVENALAQNRAVYLTRPLKGAAEKYSLSSRGLLIRVQPQPATSAPNISNPLTEDYGAMQLVGYDVDTSRLATIPTRWHAENGRVVRVTVYWRVDEAISTNAMVSLKILNKDRRVVGQIDHRPVLDAYPTSAWRVNEVIADTYDVPVFLGATPGEYGIHVTLYDTVSGAVIAARDLKKISLTPDLVAPRRAVWNIAHLTDADFGAFALAGYTLDLEAAARPGDTLPLTLLWRASQSKIADSLRVRVWLEDNEGKSVASRDAPVGSSLSPVSWQAGQYVRDFPSIRVPANVADGQYAVKLAVLRGDQLLGAIPLRPTIAELGTVAIKNRAHIMTAPSSIERSLEVTFEKKIRLLGYDFSVDNAHNARLTLYWKSLALMETPYTVFVHLLDQKDNVIASGDAAPGGGEFPTTSWIENEYIADVHMFEVPNDLPRGVYRIELGWYDPVTGARLVTTDGQNRIILSSINIP